MTFSGTENSYSINGQRIPTNGSPQPIAGSGSVDAGTYFFQVDDPSNPSDTPVQCIGTITGNTMSGQYGNAGTFTLTKNSP